MTDLEIVNKAKNKAILRAEKAERQLTKAIKHWVVLIIKNNA